MKKRMRLLFVFSAVLALSGTTSAWAEGDNTADCAQTVSVDINGHSHTATLQSANTNAIQQFIDTYGLGQVGSGYFFATREGNGPYICLYLANLE